MPKITSLEIENFLSHENTKLDFNKKPEFIVIKGMINNNIANSNGTGKSAIVSALLFGLTKGLNKKINLKEMIATWANKAEVAVELQNNKDNYRIERKIGRAVSSKFYKNGEEIKTQKQKQLDELILNELGIDENFMITHQFTSEIDKRFMFFTPTQKLKFFEETINFTKQNEVYKKINTKLNVLNREIDTINTKIEMMQKEKERTSALLTNNIQENIANAETKLQKLEQEKNEIENNLEIVIEEKKIKQQDFKQELLDIKREIDTKIQELLVQKDKINKEFEYEKSKLLYEIEQLEIQKQDLKKKIEELQEHNNKLIEKFNEKKAQANMYVENYKKKFELYKQGKCPTCERPFEEHDFTQLQIEKVESEKAINELKNEAMMLKNTIENGVKQINEKKQELSDVDLKIREKEQNVNALIMETNQKVNQLTLKQQKLSQEFNNRKTEIEVKYGFNQMDITIANLNSNLNNVEKQITATKYELKQLNIKLKNINNSESINNVNKQLEDLHMQKEELNETVSILKEWSAIFSPKSQLRTSLMKNYLKVFSERINYYITKLFDEDVEFNFILDENRNTVETEFIRDEYYYDFHNLSQGEKRKVEIVVLLTFYEILSLTKSNNINMIILDEALDGLDGNSTKTMVQLLKDFSEQFETDIILISHIGEINKEETYLIQQYT